MERGIYIIQLNSNYNLDDIDDIDDIVWYFDEAYPHYEDNEIHFVGTAERLWELTRALQSLEIDEPIIERVF
jgi:hypothetical protein